ncbi:MAG: DedA family protein [Pirellulales bacterium]|nr:DedA family protein [Pirellulales bacterium]
MRDIWDLFVHLDVHLKGVLEDYGVWTYAILFLVIFCETGLVVTPFLPGDSLLFAAGAFAASPEFEGLLDPTLLFLLLSAAAILGDTVNYWIGHYIGPRAFTGRVRFLKREYLDRTHRFYEKYGGKTIIIARFVPIIRTFAPFVAGIGAMNYTKFIVYNVVGGVAWVAIFVFGGYWVGDQVKGQFHWVILAIIIISVLPMVFEYFRARREKRKAKSNPETRL